MSSKSDDEFDHLFDYDEQTILDIDKKEKEFLSQHPTIAPENSKPLSDTLYPSTNYGPLMKNSSTVSDTFDVGQVNEELYKNWIQKYIEKEGEVSIVRDKLNQLEKENANLKQNVQKLTSLHNEEIKKLTEKNDKTVEKLRTEFLFQMQESQTHRFSSIPSVEIKTSSHPPHSNSANFPSLQTFHNPPKKPEPPTTNSVGTMTISTEIMRSHPTSEISSVNMPLYIENFVNISQYEDLKSVFRMIALDTKSYLLSLQSQSSIVKFTSGNYLLNTVDKLINSVQNLDKDHSILKYILQLLLSLSSEPCPVLRNLLLNANKDYQNEVLLKLSNIFDLNRELIKEGKSHVREICCDMLLLFEICASFPSDCSNYLCFTFLLTGDLFRILLCTKVDYTVSLRAVSLLIAIASDKGLIKIFLEKEYMPLIYKILVDISDLNESDYLKQEALELQRIIANFFCIITMNHLSSFSALYDPSRQLASYMTILIQRDLDILMEDQRACNLMNSLVGWIHFLHHSVLRAQELFLPGLVSCCLDYHRLIYCLITISENSPLIFNVQIADIARDLLCFFDVDDCNYSNLESQEMKLCKVQNKGF